MHVAGWDLAELFGAEMVCRLKAVFVFVSCWELCLCISTTPSPLLLYGIE